MELLNKIQQMLKVPKNQFNPFGKFNYRSAEDILEAVKPLLDKGTLICSDEVVHVGDRVYIKTTATLYDKSTSQSACGFAREPLSKKGMDDSQLTGSTASYAKKRALSNLFSLDDEKDADAINNKKYNQQDNIIEERDKIIKKYNDLKDNQLPEAKPVAEPTTKLPYRAPNATEQGIIRKVYDELTKQVADDYMVDMTMLKKAIWNEFGKYPTKEESISKILQVIVPADVAKKNDFISGID